MFAGIGGFRTGLTNAGDFFMPVGWCEKDKHAQKAYRLLYGTEGEYFCDDARIINPADLPDFDLICGGFPCQPFSVAGQRLGFADERGTLFHEICRLAEARHPKYLLLENVPGLLTHEGGQTFLAILTALEQLGYSLEWCVVNSANFGVPQDRKRVYIVGYLDSRLSGKIYPVRESTYSNLKQLIPGRQGQRVYSPDGAAVTSANIYVSFFSAPTAFTLYGGSFLTCFCPAGAVDFYSIIAHELMHGFASEKLTELYRQHVESNEKLRACHRALLEDWQSGDEEEFVMAAEYYLCYLSGNYSEERLLERAKKEYGGNCPTSVAVFELLLQEPQIPEDYDKWLIEQFEGNKLSVCD